MTLEEVTTLPRLETGSTIGTTGINAFTHCQRKAVNTPTVKRFFSPSAVVFENEDGIEHIVALSTNDIGCVIINVHGFDVQLCQHDAMVQMSVAKEYFRLSKLEDELDLSDFAIALLNHLDKYLFEKDYQYVDLFLNAVNPAKHSSRALLGLLTITLPFKSNLPSRVGLFESIRGVLRKRMKAQEAEQVLAGLK